MHTDMNQNPVTVGDSVVLEDYWAKRRARRCVLVAKHKFGPLWVAAPVESQSEENEFLISSNNFKKE